MAEVSRGAAGAIAAALAALSVAWYGCAARAPFDPDQVPDAYARPSGALMWPGATRAYWVTPEGDLYNGDWEVRIRPHAGADSAGAPRRIASPERWRPDLHWARTSGGVRWDFEAVALPGPAGRDSGLLVSLEILARNDGPAATEAAVELELAQPDHSPPFAAWDAAERPPAPRWGTGREEGEVLAWCDRAANGATLAARWHLAAGRSARLRVVLPAYPEHGRDLAAWARTPHRARVAEARRYWERTLSHGASFELGDPEAEDALRSAVVVMLSCEERRGADWVPLGGPFQYRDVWLRDGARTVEALSVAGFTAEARALCAGMLRLQWPQGAFLSQRGQLDGTGQALWAFAQAMERPAVAESIGRFADAAERAWRWSEWQRGFGRASGWHLATLMPFADPRDNELARAQLVGDDAWMIAGYRAAARLLRSAGRGSIADSVIASAALYRRDFMAALAATGSADVPPSWQGIGRDWGNLSVSYPCGVLAPRDPIAVALARRALADHAGPGLLSYGTADTLHYYYGADLGTWALVAGRATDANRMLDAMLHWRNASGGAGELFTRSGDYGRNLPPHATSAAALVTLVRNALVYDDADTLALTLGARARWWRGARVRRAPTRWGRIDLEFRRGDTDAEWRWTPVPVWTSLTLPPGTRLAAAPEAPLERGSSDRMVLAPPGSGRARVAVVAAAASP